MGCHILQNNGSNRIEVTQWSSACVRGSSGSAVEVDWGLLQLGPMFRSAFLWSLVSGLHLSQWLRSSSHNTVIHCNEQDLHRRFLTVWLKERFLREPCSSERVLITWNVTHAEYPWEKLCSFWSLHSDLLFVLPDVECQERFCHPLSLTKI